MNLSSSLPRRAPHTGAGVLVALLCAGLLGGAQSFAEPVSQTESWAARASQEHVQRGVELYRRHDVSGAIRELSEAARLTPDSAQVLFMLGNAYCRAGQFHTAIPWYQKAARLRPDHSDTQLNLGFAFYRSGHPREAREAWAEAVQLAKYDALVRAAFAVGELLIGESESAVFHFSVAVYLDPECGTKEYYTRDFRWGADGVADVSRLAKMMELEGW
jgi:cytochrome c-type biogenesis protein CcmH/NrfG